MSALCQKRTYAPQQNTSLFADPVGIDVGQFLDHKRLVIPISGFG